jgi:hypothetical protein
MLKVQESEETEGGGQSILRSADSTSSTDDLERADNTIGEINPGAQIFELEQRRQVSYFRVVDKIGINQSI